MCHYLGNFHVIKSNSLVLQTFEFGFTNQSKIWYHIIYNLYNYFFQKRTLAIIIFLHFYIVFEEAQCQLAFILWSWFQEQFLKSLRDNQRCHSIQLANCENFISFLMPNSTSHDYNLFSSWWFEISEPTYSRPKCWRWHEDWNL